MIPLLEPAAVPCARPPQADPPRHARPDGFRPDSARCRHYGGLIRAGTADLIG